jgi:hypothetical protein
VLASPLFDGARFARHLEYALWEMWQRHPGESSSWTSAGLHRHQTGFDLVTTGDR